jgi:hypothetical protein
MWTWIDAHELSLGIRSVSVLSSYYAVLQLGLKYGLQLHTHEVFLLGPFGGGGGGVRLKIYKGNSIFQSKYEVHMSCLIILFQL